jgi:diguanylate cyclase
LNSAYTEKIPHSHEIKGFYCHIPTELSPNGFHTNNKNNVSSTQYPEHATKAAAYITRRHSSDGQTWYRTKPEKFSLWYAYVVKSNMKLNTELDAILADHNTCPAIQSTDLFRRYIIDNELDFGHQIQTQLSNIICNLSAQSSSMSAGNQQYDTFLEQGLESLKQQLSENNMRSLLSSLLDQTRQSSELTQKFQHQMEATNQEISSLRQALQAIEKEAALDDLTQISNRGAFNKELQLQMDKHNSGSTNTLCLIITDIDHFKHCNDKYGHVMGDRILQSFAKILSHI